MLSRRSLLFAAVAASAVAVAPASAAGPQPFNDAAFAEAQKAGKPIFVAIHASWCPICKAQTPILAELMADPGSRISPISRSISTARRIWSGVSAPGCSPR